MTHVSQRVPQSLDELRAHLQEQLAFLEASAQSFDAGFHGEAKRLAVTIRLLVHDTAHSRSLLSQLDMKRTQFVDTAAPMNPRNLLTEASLVGIAMGPGGAKYFPLLDGHPLGERLTDFAKWWETPVLRDKSRTLFTRRELVLTAANQAGGAHVDPALDAAYAALTRKNSMGWVVESGTRESPVLGAELATVRQIAHEVLKTLQESYAPKPATPAPPLIASNLHAEIVAETINTAKVGRNDPCPCGSGKKYKKCHGGAA